MLAEIIVSTDSPVEYRQVHVTDLSHLYIDHAMICILSVQLCSIVLKQYVETHWNNLSEKFQEPEPPELVSVLTLQS